MPKQRRYNIPPELRAIARAVSDADVLQFPDLAPVPGRAGPPVHALRSITTELNDGVPLSTQEFRLFRAAYEECRQHLHSVTNGLITAGTPIADVLVLAVRMDTLCTDLGIALLAVFPVLREIHTYLLDLSDRLAVGRAESQRQGVLLDRLMRFLYRILERGERALREYEAWEGQLSSSLSGRGGAAPDDTSSPATSPSAATSPSPATSRSPSAGCGRRVSVAASDIELASRINSAQPPAVAGRSRYDGAAAADSHRPSSGAADSQEAVPLSGRRRLPSHVADAVASVNADLVVHFAHIRWYVKVTDQASVYFDAHLYLEEHALRATWDMHVGRNRAACTREEFLPLLQLFPLWTHPAVMSVADFKDGGVVSLYSLQRLLRLWGPLQLLDVNLRHDMEHGAVDLSQPFAYLAYTLASRSDAKPGDYVVGLSDVIGELRVAVLRRTRGHRWHLYAASEAQQHERSFATKLTCGDARDDMAGLGGSPTQARKNIATVSYTLSHATGAWLVKGLAREEFDSAADACAAFAEIFQRPRGQPLSLFRDAVRQAKLGLPESVPPSPVGRREASSVNAAEEAEGNASALHRACYRNNTRYVRTLLDRGGGTVVNAALVDPLVCDAFCWTPLLCAVNNPHSDPVEVVRLLLRAGAEADYRDDADCTALYYAIANGYAETVGVLLEHCPTLSTSPYTVPLLVAIGAHDCHLRECDIHRLREVVPAAAVLRFVAAYETSYAMVALASTIVEEKLNGKDHRVTTAERHLVTQRCTAGAAGAERYTTAEAQQLKQWVQHHTHCCRLAQYDVQEAVRVLYARQYALSWRVWLDALDAAAAAAAATATSSTTIGTVTANGPAVRMSRGFGGSQHAFTPMQSFPAPPSPPWLRAELAGSRASRGAGGGAILGPSRHQAAARAAADPLLMAIDSIEYII